MVRFSEGDPSAEGGGRIAPVIPLFGGPEVSTGAARSAPAIPLASVHDDHAGYGSGPGWNSTWGDDTSYDDAPDDDAPDDGAAGEPDPLQPALDRLLRRLRRRGLSVSEATASLRDDGIDPHLAATVIAELERKRWIGDTDLAEQLVHSAVTRKSEGRRAIAQTLAQRGIPRDVADAALADLPDDDDDRALEYARSKAPAMARLEREVAVRRLVGQLSRRGYPSAVALTAARTALDEASAPARGRGVRFD